MFIWSPRPINNTTSILLSLRSNKAWTQSNFQKNSVNNFFLDKPEKEEIVLKNEFKYPAGCKEDGCQYKATWETNENDEIAFTVKGVKYLVFFSSCSLKRREKYINWDSQRLDGLEVAFQVLMPEESGSNYEVWK